MSANVKDVPSVPTFSLRSIIVRHPLPAYFLFAFLGTWLMILPLVLSQGGVGLLPYSLPEAVFQLIFIGAAYAGPALGAFLITALESGKPGVRQLLRRIVLWRVGIQWYFVALFGFLSIWLAAYNLVYRGAPVINLIQNWSLLISVFLPSVIFGIFVPSLGEEPGWRGFALPRLQASYGPLLGTAILGLLHGLWHLPVFFTQLGGPFTPDGFLAFVLTAMAGTTIYTWVFNHTRTSILIAILMHASSNAATPLMTALIPADTPLSPWAMSLASSGWLNVIAFGIVAVALILLTRGRLGYADKDR